MLFTYCNLLVIFGSGLILAGTLPAMAAEAQHSPAGLWKTWDDRTHQARGTIRIYEENGTFAGKIESSFNAAELTERCNKCSGDRKGAPVIGLVIMRGMTRHGREFDGGDILDPESGYIYKCRFVLSSDGEKLFLRGYLGMSIFGRTQTWTRLETTSPTSLPATSGHSLASIDAESTK